jgi:copper chaperone CopZ
LFYGDRNEHTPKSLLAFHEEEIMNRKALIAAILLLCLFLLSCATTTNISTKVIPDTARVVKLYVPACTWENTEAEIREILMRIQGVYDVNGDTLSQHVNVTFDPEKTNVAALVKALSDGEFPIKGTPIFIK